MSVVEDFKRYPAPSDSLSRSTPVTTDPQGAPTPSRDRGDTVSETDEGDTSDVSVTAEDLELFDRCVVVCWDGVSL